MTDQDTAERVVDAAQAALILHKSGGCHIPELIDAVRECGFDAQAYVVQNKDLQLAGFTSADALPHFLCFGFAENRMVSAAPLPAGLAGLAQMEIANDVYKNGVLRALYLGQMRAANAENRLWAGDGAEILAGLKGAGAAPFVLIGDSHAGLYERTAITPGRWLAPLLLNCTGGSASGLANENSKSGYGKKILRWAKTAFVQSPQFDLPVLLKFGQVDAEFGWNFRRVRDNVTKFSIVQFRSFATRAVRNYAAYLKTLASFIRPELLLVCSIFPPALSDAAWREGYMNAHIGFLEGDRDVAALKEGIMRLETPDLATRTRLHLIYNGLLKEACAASGLRFVDDFPLFLGEAGVVDERFLRESHGTSHHIDFCPTEAVMAAALPGLVGVTR